MAPLCGELVAAVMTPLAPAQAQSFTRGGTNSTTTTTDYNLGTNWSNAPTGAPPVVATQSAIFDTTGSASVAVTSGSIAPASWTLTAGAVLFDRIMVVTPYAAGHFTTYSLPAYAEQVLAGSGTFALNYAAKDAILAPSSVFASTVRSRWRTASSRSAGGWPGHTTIRPTAMSPVFQTLPGAAFVVNGAAQAQDSG
jgi:hypothetical protein